MPKPVSSPPVVSGPRALQRMWISLARRKWSSLVVVPADARAPAGEVAATFAEAARAFELGPHRVIDALGASMADGSRLAQDLTTSAGAGVRTVAAVDYPMANPSGVPLIVAADAALVVVSYGTSDVASALLSIGLVGRERILGCVAVPARRKRRGGAPGPEPR